jgi:hypothetical protein
MDFSKLNMFRHKESKFASSKGRSSSSGPNSVLDDSQQFHTFT